MDEQLKASWLNWCKRRAEELARPESWLGLAGLYWLEEGDNPVGSAETCRVRLPTGPAYLGNLQVVGRQVFWQRPDAEPSELATDRNGPPAAVHWQNWAFFVVDREGRLAARVRDLAWAERQPFAGLRYFDFAPTWRISAAWQSLSPPLVMEVPNVTGDLKSVEVAFKAVFEVAGQSVELLPMSVSDEEIFFVFRDRTSGKESYGAGRFLKAKPTADGRIVLDFNRAFNPPCAFTAFATCPLPPPENWLPFPVMAGEQKYSGEH